MLLEPPCLSLLPLAWFVWLPPAGLPAGPGGALGAVEGGSWLAVLSGIVVLALQVRGDTVATLQLLYQGCLSLAR